MKIRRLSEFQGRFVYPNFDTDHELLMESFLDTRLGVIYQAVPWMELVSVFGLREPRKGPRPMFSPRGKIALMFLKHYAGCSDRKLIEHLNSNVHYQIFCDIVVPVGPPITNYKIVSDIRCELADRLNTGKVQQVLADKWVPYMSDLGSICMDATCYESDMRHPTDIKLLWEAVEWNHRLLREHCKVLGLPLPRTKFNKWAGRYSGHSKSRRPSKKQRRGMTRGLLRLLDKLHPILSELEKEHAISYGSDRSKRRRATATILRQQAQQFHKGTKPTGRIVSLDRPYIRPIKRGKEVRATEFGAKVNKLQVDGISFIEHLSFDNFNEGTRLKRTVWLAQPLFRTKTKMLGADAIYATNANRNFVTANGIKTDFKRKGKKTGHHEHFGILAKMITKERATRLEGSFGTDKEHFLLKKIKARTEKTEMLWIFFGIHTSNALKIGQRIQNQTQKAA
ncbi:transposase [Muricauda sp. SCSIO 64092]|uniref:transposase n=1 Tax=Allomuricauda sp. SCSIO 64092 TaxID=2908842 RepID=UPI001FF1D4C2|nr:transposase [Muricauda sp. SCSIO 64092]UOY06760.1 transposase [Muricauda sp. SCSIO 64092]